MNFYSFKRLAKNRAKDLFDVNIGLDLVPVLKEGERFDYTKFYGVSQERDKKFR